MPSVQDLSTDPETLTSFGPPKEENAPNSSNIFQFVVNLFTPKKDAAKRSKKAIKDNRRGQTVRPSVLDLENSNSSGKRMVVKSPLPHDPGSEVELRLRSLSAILKDFPKLMKGQQTVQSEQSSSSESQEDVSPSLSAAELRQYWMPDDQCHECYECGEKFTTFRRRHHCRICGQIFCSRCCNQLISGKIMGRPGMLRSCTYCCKLVLTFAQDSVPRGFVHSSGAPSMDTANDDSTLDTSVMNESLLLYGNSQGVAQSHSTNSLRRHTQSSAPLRHETPAAEDQLFARGPFETVHPSTIMSPIRDVHGRKPPVYIFDATPDAITPSILGNDVKDELVQDSTQLHLLWRKITDEIQGIEFRDHRFRLRKYSSCITGQELVEWLIRNDVASTRAQGCAIGQALYEGKWLKPVTDLGGLFQDGYVLFQSGKKTPSSARGNRIEIYPDHFANFSDDGEGDTLQTMADREPIWVQEIKCGEDEEDEADGFHERVSESDMTWSADMQNNLHESLLYSDEDRSTSDKSVVSFSSFVEIDEGNDVIKYTRPTSMYSSYPGQQRSSHSPQPSYDDSGLTSISADYLRNFITWNGTYLSQTWIAPSSGWREGDLQSAFLESHDKRAFQWLREIYLRHNLAFLRQLLHNKRLDTAWAEILVPLAKHAAESILPNPNVSMDVCHYFQIKKMPDGPRNHSQVINGVVCTKNVVHKQMRTDIADPAILLLAIPLEYQRVHLKLSALDPIVRQEREFYKHLISRITARQPQLVLVQCTVSHIAQDLLLQAGITLVINVKPSVMERVARSTEADIVYSIDQLMQAKLGRCSRFYVKHHIYTKPRFHDSTSGRTTKTLMYFDGCNPIFGCTVILRGKNDDVPTYRNSSKELTKVQEVFRFLVRAMFHARLELSYLIDQHGFGKLLKKQPSRQQSRHRSDSETTTKPSESGSQETLIDHPAAEPVKFKCVIEDFSTPPDSDTDARQEDGTQKPFLVPPAPPGRCDIGVDARSESQFTAVNPELFHATLKSVLLSISPLIQPRLPFLYAPKNLNSPVHKFLPAKLFWSCAFEAKSPKFVKSQPSALEVDHGAAIRSRSNTVESLVQEKLWLTPPHQSYKSVNSMDYEDSTGSADTLDNSVGSREVLDDGTVTPVPRKERPNPHASCYSQQYKLHRNDALRNSGEVLQTAHSNVNTKLHTWEQKLVDLIFNPTAASHNKREKLASPEPLLQNGSNGNLKRKSTFSPPFSSSKNELDSTLTEDLGSSQIEIGQAECRKLHEFVTSSLTEPSSSNGVKDLLASYRAYAGLSTTTQDRKPLAPNEEKAAQPTPDTNSVFDEEKNFPTDDASGPKSMLDCMDPVSHQHICALFSSYSSQSPNAPYFCVLPWVVDIDFYRGNDITLGGFLERYCFRPSYHCPNSTCRRPMVEHIRSFVHGNACMTVVLKELSKPFHQSSILTWNWNHVTMKSSDIKTMSHDAWSMSFAKYLELNLEGLTIPECGSSPRQRRNVHKLDVLSEEWELRPFTSFQYFMFRDIVAAFKCFPISISEVVFPAFELQQSSDDPASFSHQIYQDFDEELITYQDFYSAVETLSERVTETLDTVQDCIHTSKCSGDTFAEEPPPARERYFADCANSYSEEKGNLMDEIGFLKSLLKSRTSQEPPKNADNNGVLDDWGEIGPECEDVLLPKDLAVEVSTRILHLKCDICEIVQTWNEKLAEAHDKDRTSYWTSSKRKAGGSPQMNKKYAKIPEETAENVSDRSIETIGPTSLSEDVGHLKVVEQEQDLAGMLSRSTDSSSIGEASDPRQPTDGKSSAKPKKGNPTEGKNVDKSLSYKRLSRTGSSVKFLVTRLLPGNILIPSVPMPFSAEEHFLLPECLSTNVVVRDAEPTSIIAYTLSSSNYKKAVSELVTLSDGSVEACDGVLMTDKAQDTEKNSDQRLPNARMKRSQESSKAEREISSESEIEDMPDSSIISVTSSLSSGPANSPHVEIQFSDSTSRFYCKVYFAKVFENFRSKILRGGEKQYLTSLSRSVKWLARGGKSGSTFHKTRDDQFILKQMSYFELQSFLEFAPKYVDYITNCIEKQEATAISKILGVYRISFRNSGTSRSLKQDVLVIENLFYQKKIGQIFDLKGSVRNRHVKANSTNATPDAGSHADQNDVVLLDENLLKMMCNNPIYVHEHTKHLLMSAIRRDADFLSRNLIMDYSLLVGMEEKDNIVVGIIDFIRTFTWDKKLEMVVKWSSSRSMPTVVSPELYKNRFCEAMDRYFQVVPDRWYGMRAF